MLSAVKLSMLGQITDFAHAHSSKASLISLSPADRQLP